jgi:hypothetical protein
MNLFFARNMNIINNLKGKTHLPLPYIRLSFALQAQLNLR